MVDTSKFTNQNNSAQKNWRKNNVNSSYSLETAAEEKDSLEGNPLLGMI